MDSSDRTRTRRLVLVYGAYHGGWCWRRVTQILSARGVDAYTPTLTGLGQRRHLLTPETTLSTHIEDIVNLFEPASATPYRRSLIASAPAGITPPAVNFAALWEAVRSDVAASPCLNKNRQCSFCPT
jgi:hypothetical protein